MNIIPKSRFSKLLVSATLTLSIVLSAGTMFTNTHSAYASTASSSVADNVIATGKQFLGVPYRFGASSNSTSAFDCSSFTQYVFKQNGISIPRSSLQQSKAGTFVPRDQLQPGDLVFSDTNRDGVINHVSIYIGNGQLLHTYKVGIGVTISTFAGSTWDRTYVTARRVLPSNGQPVGVTTPSTPTTPTTPSSVTNTDPQTDNTQVKQPTTTRSKHSHYQKGEH